MRRRVRSSKDIRRAVAAAGDVDDVVHVDIVEIIDCYIDPLEQVVERALNVSIFGSPAPDALLQVPDDGEPAACGAADMSFLDVWIANYVRVVWNHTAFSNYICFKQFLEIIGFVL